ncbi:4Fe-4S binding protein [Nonomuraea sp. CA-218870]|uniref:NuoI/complex I 23 kDa subunit family protein n=1 Tax=Nonomuraea sp. CA-218870 TaxID=3239998 RepID=UPI003D8B087D
MARIPGVGLAKGLTITLRHMLRKSVTQQYPEVRPDLPPRSRGVIALVEENCTSCMLCARECPDWCIYIDSHKETIPAPEGGRPRQRNVLDRFAIDFSLCMYCGICIEVCPFDALFWSPEFEYAEGDISDLLHEKDKLATWVPTVPPPPAHDPGADPPKELSAAPRRPARAKAAEPAAAPRADAPGRTAEQSTSGPAQALSGPDTTPGSAPARGPAAARGPAVARGPAAEGGAASAGDAAQAGGVAPESGPAPEGSEREGSALEGSGADSEAGSGADSGRRAPEAAPGRRPRRAVTNVRGIRPPGALPADNPPGAGTGGPATPTAPEAAGRGADDTGAEAGDAPAEHHGRGASDAAGETSSADEGPASSTGEEPGPEFSTGREESRPEHGSGEQTSGARPRRRRMADPRSIRPPGRLGHEEPREPEED